MEKTVYQLDNNKKIINVVIINDKDDYDFDYIGAITGPDIGWTHVSDMIYINLNNEKIDLTDLQEIEAIEVSDNPSIKETNTNITEEQIDEILAGL